jgi:hypothetical protein
MILGIIINVGGVPTDNRGYIGNRYLYVLLTCTESFTFTELSADFLQ